MRHKINGTTNRWYTTETITVKYSQWDLSPDQNTAQNSIAAEGPKGQTHASSLYGTYAQYWMLHIDRAWDRIILWVQKLRDTRFTAMGIFEKIRLKSWRAQWPHLPWTSSTNGTSCYWEFFMRKRYLSHLILAFMTEAAPGKYDGDRPHPRRNPLEG